ncbi:MAG TPA: Gfo/Idh/MocA family oxidoreductase, partial [Pseudoxanthomonas sp.]|nr:Gfo/Idh/MocA family oxidoreductase [Pseudoxanthomonas sp.]
MNAQLRPTAAAPRLGFLGVGWIGRQRMQVLAESGVATVGAIADASREAALAAQEHAPDAAIVDDLDALLALELDGIVIATPSGAHAAQAIAALERGMAVFCQKPLTRTAEEAEQVLAAARGADRLIGVDFSYRHVAGVAQLRELVRSGGLGRVHAIDLTFHNAYGPDKDWFYDMARSGGGCVMDLGVHLVDLALWALDFPEVADVRGRLFAGGEPLRDPAAQVEDYAVATIELK